MIKIEAFNKEIDEVLNELNTKEDGLDEEEVIKRQKKYGLNILPKEEKTSVFKIFINEFLDPIVILLLVAIIFSFIAGEVIDAIAIFLIVIVDVIMGTYEENKANNTAEALEKLVTVMVRVIRNKKEVEVKSEELVIGDICLLESGDKISADMRIIDSHNLMVNEAILTGESVEIEKNSKKLSKENLSITEQNNILFSGTTIVKLKKKNLL